MVDSISGNSISQDLAIRTAQSNDVEKVNVQSAASTQTAAPDGTQTVDQATISDEARAAYESNKEVLRFSRLAQRGAEPYNSDRVSELKDIIQKGGLSNYLRSVNSDDLAQSLINSPAKQYLTGT